MDNETSRALVIYDTTGKVIATYFGASEDDVPEGLPYTWVDYPENAILLRIDISTGLPEFEYLPDSVIGLMQSKINKLENKTNSAVDQFNMDIGNMSGAVGRNTDDLLVTQMAIAELYEMMLGE